MRSAQVLGKLAPPQKASRRDDVYSNDGIWRTAFRIIGFKDGWFLIEKGLHPFEEPVLFRLVGRRSTGGVKTYHGRGWIAAKLVGGQYANGANHPLESLYQEPRADSERKPAKNARGAGVGSDGGSKVVLACGKG